jgi:hypothetical protein
VDAKKSSGERSLIAPLTHFKRLKSISAFSHSFQLVDFGTQLTSAKKVMSVLGGIMIISHKKKKKKEEEEEENEKLFPAKMKFSSLTI